MSLTIGDVLQKTAGYFTSKGIESARLDAEMLLAHVLGLDRVGLYTDYQRPLTTAEVDAFREVMARRGRREPLAYIIGHKEFYGLDFLVAPAVLIPRPETELLVEAVLKYLREFARDEEAPQIIEIGVGSAAISAAVAANYPCYITASDISRDVLRVAAQNIERPELKGKVNLVLGPYFTGVPETLLGKVKVIVSNPPYLTKKELEQAQPELKYEPTQALDGGIDGLEPYRVIVKEAPRWLQPGGLLALEIGAGQARTVGALIANSGLFAPPEIQTDYAGHDRIVLAFFSQPG